MAKLLKERARKPIIEAGGAVASLTARSGQIGYQLDLYQARPGHTYSVVLTRKEMLGVVSQWIACEAERTNREPECT